MKRKILIAFLLVLTLALGTIGFAACGEYGTGNSDSASASHSSAASIDSSDGSASGGESASVSRSSSEGEASASSSSATPHDPDEFLSDEINHWIGDGKSELGPHTFKSGVCTVCHRELTETDGLEFTALKDDTYSVSGLGSAADEKFIVIPANHLGKKVSQIADNAFVTTITTEDPDLGPQTSAVDNTVTKMIYVPASVEKLGTGAFTFMKALDGLFVDEENADYLSSNGCIIEKATGTLVAGCNTSVIPDDGSITAIGDDAFAGSNIKTLVVPEGVKSVGYEAFYYCSRLSELSLPDSLEHIGQFAITNKNSALIYHDEDNLSYIGNANNPYVVLITSESAIVTANVHSGTKIIASLAFLGRESLKTVNLPDGLICIEYEAFQSSKALTKISVPNSVKVIGSNAFDSCTSLMSATLGNGITEISDYAFQNCSQLTSIEIPDSVKSIGGHAFDGCSGLETVKMGNSVETIGTSAFYGCKLITTISIPDSIVSIDSSAFTACSSLTYNNENGINYLGNDVHPYVALMSVSDSSLETYTINENTKIITSSAFSFCRMTQITIPEGVVNIGDSAFEFCSQLTSLTIPETVTSIGTYIFFGCSSLEYIVLPKSLTYVGRDILYLCSTLTDVYYTGSADEWNDIDIDMTLPSKQNADLFSKNIHFYSADAPQTEGSFWHYNGDQIEIWK